MLNVQKDVNNCALILIFLVLKIKGYFVVVYYAFYKTVWTIITAKYSGAKKAGNDMIFMLCSEECGHELKEILQAEIGFIDSIKGEGF